jgi:ribonuclease HI
MAHRDCSIFIWAPHWNWRNQRVWKLHDTNHHQRTACWQTEIQERLYHQEAHPQTEYREIFRRIWEWTQQPINHRPPETKQKHHRLFFDGGARGNPGEAGCGAVIQRFQGTSWSIVWCSATYIKKATNNQAEYLALLQGIQWAISHQVNHLTIIGDSQLVLAQVTGKYKVQNRTLKTIQREIMWNAHQLKTMRVHHTRRHHNATADALANIAMNQRQSYTHHFHSGVSAKWIDKDLEALLANDNQYTITT